MEIEVDGRSYGAETVRNAIEEALVGRAPVAVMDESGLRDGIADRIRWALGAAILIASQDEADDSTRFAAESAAIHLEQARDMLQALARR